jgi:hypothetical protein
MKPMSAKLTSAHGFMLLRLRGFCFSSIGGGGEVMVGEA